MNKKGKRMLVLTVLLFLSGCKNEESGHTDFSETLMATDKVQEW